MALTPKTAAPTPDASAAAVLAGAFGTPEVKHSTPADSAAVHDDDLPFTPLAAAPVIPVAVAPASAPAPVVPVATAQSSAVSVYEDAKAKGKAINADIAKLFLPDGQSVPFGDFTQFKASAGGKIASADTSVKPLGRWMKGTVLSIGKRMEVGPGTEGASYKKYVGFSDDCATMTRIIGAEDTPELGRFVGKPVQQYVDWLRENNLPNADSRNFVDVVVWVEGAQSPAAEVGVAVMLSLPPTSASELSKYFNQLKMSCAAAAQGLKGAMIPEDPFSIYAWAEDAAKGDKQWTKLKFGRTLPDAVA